MSEQICLALSQAQGHWVRGEADDCWTVTDKDNNTIWAFPRGMDERKVMSAIRLGRKYELEALNIGIAMGKHIAKEIVNLETARLKNQIVSLEEMNGRLSQQLEKHIIGAN